MVRKRVAASPAPGRPLLDAKEDAGLRLVQQISDRGFSRAEQWLLRLLRPAGRLYWALRVGARFASSPPPWRVRRILVVRQSWLGDLVVFLPTLAALRARFPGAHLTLGVQAGFGTGGILEASGLVDEVREITFPRGGATRLAGVARLFASGYDLVVHGAWYYMLRAAFFAGAPLTIGIDYRHPRQSQLDRRVALQPLRHETDNNLAVAEALGAQPEPAARVPRLALIDDPQRLSALRARLELTVDGPLMAMHPGSKRLSRRWPAARFAELATCLLEERPTLRIVLTGSQDEHALAESVEALVPKPLQPRLVNAAGTCGLAELRLLLGACEVLVCNDTGVMHVARAQGTPLVALLGPENDLRWGPHPLGPAPTISLRHRVPCAPCDRDRCEPHWCMRLLSVAEVQRAVVRLAAVTTADRNADDAGDVLVALERRQRQHGWSDLAAAGYEVPLVTVVLVRSPADGPADADADADVDVDVDREGWRSGLDAVAAQRYPRMEVIVVTSGDVVPAPTAAVAASLEKNIDRVVALHVSPEGHRAWTAIADEARGKFICLASTGQVCRWRSDKLADDVSALVRTPAAAFTTGLSALADDPVEGRSDEPEPWTFRRAAVSAAFAEAGASPAAARRPGNADDANRPDLEATLRARLTPTLATVSGGFVAQPFAESRHDETDLSSQ